MDCRAGSYEDQGMEERRTMTQANVKIVGTEDNPINVYWNVSNKKTDEYLLILSICSGAYGDEFLDKESFVYLCNKFFKYAKKKDIYYQQFEYVILNGNEECSLFLRDLIFKKWKFVFEYKGEKIALA